MAQRPQSTSAQQQPFINLVEVEQLAKATLPRMAYDYFAAGAETQQTVGDNRSAFGQYRILPRILVDVSKVSTSCNMFGESSKCNGIKPSTMQVSSCLTSPVPSDAC